MNTDNISRFLREQYSDERLAALLAHAQDGKLVYSSCCCLVGASNADHPLTDEARPEGLCHYDYAIRMAYAPEAEDEFRRMGFDEESGLYSDEFRRERLIPIMIAEQERRATGLVEQLEETAVQWFESQRQPIS